MTTRMQLIFWLICLAVISLFILAFRNVLAPFVIGITIAYLLNPLVLRIEEFGANRIIATIAILASFFLLLTGMLVLIVPPLINELAQLAESLPGYLQTLGERLQPYMSMIEEEVDSGNLEQNVREMLQSNIGNAFSFSSSLLASILSGGRALVDFLSLLLITPLVAFFMMQEWPQITGKIDELIPRNNYDEINDLLGQIDKKISGFVRGQLMVALSLGLIYAVALTIADLEFGFLIGLTAGLLSIVPLFGSIVGLVVSVVVAWFQSTDITFTLSIAAIFLAGQVLEGNFITPKLLGGSVGLHPMWILFSIMAGASLFGIVGMMIAVPIAATIGVLLGFAIEQYRQSDYYKSE